jgi:hypothetical protein
MDTKIGRGNFNREWREGTRIGLSESASNGAFFNHECTRMGANPIYHEDTEDPKWFEIDNPEPETRNPEL